MTGVIAAVFLTACPTEDPVRVTVVVVLATDQNTTVDPKLVDLAKEVQKRDETLTGFKIKAAEAKSIPIGDGYTFELLDKEVLRVRVERSRDADGRINLTIKPPGLEKITYHCTCGKFFPVVTPYQTKGGEVLIIAVMAKPCNVGKGAGKKVQAGWFPWRD
jgi:hypothetical protein